MNNNLTKQLFDFLSNRLSEKDLITFHSLLIEVLSETIKNNQISLIPKPDNNNIWDRFLKNSVFTIDKIGEVI